MCLALSMATYTGMEYWLDLTCGELMEHEQDVTWLNKQQEK